MAKILVVDDVEGMRSALKEVLGKHGHDVTEAANGRMAKEILENSPFDLVVTDIQMPFWNGIDLLKWVKANTQTPVILMTGFSQILETQEAISLGADDFLTKPIKHGEILGAVERLIEKHSAHDQLELDRDDEFCRIPIEDFISSSHLNASIYVRLSSTKYVRVAHSGDTIPPDRVDNYKQRGLNYLYTLKEDFANVVGFNLYLAKAVLANKELAREKKAAFLRYSTETVLEQIHVNGIDERSFNYAKECVTSYLQLITESVTLLDLLQSLNDHATWIYAHSMGVSVYSTMIARKMGWTSRTTMFKIGLCGLLHDVGKKEIDPVILEKRRFGLSREERSLYESHPVRGQGILTSLKELPDDVAQVALEHHEDCLGKGFPQRLSKHRIHPLARVVGLANQFCDFAIRSPHSTGASAHEALQHLETMENHFDPPALQALQQLCIS